MRNYYIDPVELKQELVSYVNSCIFKDNGKIWKKGIISEKLGSMILSMAIGLSKRKNWSGYSYIEDMVSEGIIMVVKYIHNFNPDIPNSNAFAYIDRLLTNAFIQYMQKQHKHSDVKQYLFDKKGNIDNKVYVGHAVNYEELLENDREI